MHRWMMIIAFLAGTLAFVMAWIYAVTDWHKRSREHMLIVVGAFVVAGVAFWLFALRRAFALTGHYWLLRATSPILLALCVPVVSGLIAAAVLCTRAARQDRAERQRQLPKDSPPRPPNEPA